MRHSVLLTDFYQLSMAYGYWQRDMHHQEAVFHLFFRRTPHQGDYVIASGLASVIEFINAFHFSDEDIDYIKSIKNPAFSDAFLTYLKTLRFTGDVDAVPEGTVVFANEPLLRIKAPLLLCQLLETPLINMINFSSAVSTLASRIRTLVHDDALFEFGLRRAQGPNGGLTASRAAYIGGCDATSNMLAGKHFQIPVVGTMSHSWVMAFDNELTAFETYAQLFPGNVILLVDTYDSQAGFDHAIAVGKQLKARGVQLKGIRLDSGELSVLSRMAREKLDLAGFSDTKIYVSGDLTEARIADLKSMNAPIQGWGVGTQLSTSYEQPALDMVYKLGAIQKNNQWQYKLKRSDNRMKTSDPGVLQVRRYSQNDRWLRDVIYHRDCGILSGEKNTSITEEELLIPIFQDGKLVYIAPPIIEIRNHSIAQVKQFHASKGVGYSVQRDSQLLRLKEKLMEENP